MLAYGLMMGVAAYLLLMVTRSFFRIDEGYLGVKTTFGAAVVGDGKALELYSPGLHFKWPWQKVHRVATMEQNLDLSGEAGRMAMAEDGTVLRVDAILRFAPAKEQLHAFLFGMKAPLEHITESFTCLLRNEMANFGKAGRDSMPRVSVSSCPGGIEKMQRENDAGSYALIRRERHELNRRIEGFCRERVGERYGVHFNAVDLTDIFPPDELVEALNAVMRANAEADEAYASAEADCERQILAAERGVEIAKARALAAEREIRTLATYLDELRQNKTLGLYVQRRRAEVLSQSKSYFLRSP
ncbi:SPFH/Band 7/PHB domain protein [Pendulispora rubella]|uniref:SPFH/Band 7/PHB domain protein n=1 Tax=Pendulispora rubella TaxID=2741070 RepID=A0ABZ2L1T2_9BACT